MSSNKQSVELTDITTPLLPATEGLSREDRDASTTTPIIEKTLDFLLDCAERGENRGRQRPHSICKVPRMLRDLNEAAFIPQLVSIGPIHREDPKLTEFEWQKECYLNGLLKRCHDSTPKKTLEACLLEVNTLIDQIRESYVGVIKNYSDFDLARMMVMDGCFILEFCFKHEDDENMYLQMQNIRIAMDLMLLENQVPFFVLQALFDCCMGERSFILNDVLDRYLAPYIQLFRSDVLPEKNSILSNVFDKFLALYIKLFRSTLPEKIPTTYVDSSTHDHVLAYLHKRYQLPVFAKSSNPIDAEASKLVYHSIVELDRSGINFKPHQEDEWSMTIKFQSPLFPCVPWFGRKATLLMPTLVIDDFTELILRNFIAYEQSFCQDRYYFTSYVHVMSMLIDIQEDVAKLAESKVLVNALGSNQYAADMLLKVDRNMSAADFYYTKEFKQMYKYCNSIWPTYKRIYFSNPLNDINLLLGIIAFLATVTSAIFAILDYFR